MAFGLLYDYLMGQCNEGYRYFGAHFETRVIKNKKVKGVCFRLYAPLVEDVSVIGEWNNFDATANKMDKIDSSGVFETFVPNLKEYQIYKYHFKNCNGVYVDKADPFAFFSELRPNTCSKLFNIEGFPWGDKVFLKNRSNNFNKPMSIYEVHLGSWKIKNNDEYYSYEEMAELLIPYLKENGYTHVELMPICQHPFDGSWGYQAIGFFSSDSRYGNPKQLMQFVNLLHKAGIGVILDFAPVHFALDSYSLREFDGSCLYEYSDPRYTISPWGSAQFDLGKDPVRSFLISAMDYFLTYFHFDGLRIDAVSNIIYWNGDKNRGVNEGAIEFIKRLNGKLHYSHPGIMMIAEDSTDYLGVTSSLESGGLGFDYKWDLGWMNDTLKYYSLDPIYKKYDHNKLTFSMAYFYSEKFLLPLSHDEVVHGKGTMINKMWGDYETKFALLRNLYAYQMAHPGKKLNFMGNELASFDEWNEKKSLPWNLLSFPRHDCIKRLCRDLNLIYRYHIALYGDEYNTSSFRWTMVDNMEQSVFAFERSFGKEVILFVFNMTPNFYESYDVPTYQNGQFSEIFNSDKDVYGGNNQYNGLKLKTYPGGPENKPNHISIKLAGFAACYFLLSNDKKVTIKQNVKKNKKD